MSFVHAIATRNIQRATRKAIAHFRKYIDASSRVQAVFVFVMAIALDPRNNKSE